MGTPMRHENRGIFIPKTGDWGEGMFGFAEQFYIRYIH